eukprot:2202415-Rhodomonas_salina.1
MWWTVMQQAKVGEIATVKQQDQFHVGDSTELMHDEPTYTAVQWAMFCFDFAADSQRMYPAQCNGMKTREPTVSPEELGHRVHLRSL